MVTIFDALEHMELSELVFLYNEAQDISNGKNKDLVKLYNIALMYVYGEGNLKSLDFAQIEYMREILEKYILMKV